MTTHVRRWLLRTITLLLASSAASAILWAPTADAATCKASTCNGKNPQSYGCAKDAKTVADALTRAGHVIELRYSKKCKAVWVRGDHYSSVKVQAGYIDYYGTWRLQKSYTGTGRQGWITNGDPYWSWTPMISIHAYERYQMWGDGSYWSWRNTIDGCSDSTC